MAGVLNKRTSVAGRKPNAASVAYGEICVNYSTDTPTISIKDSSNIIRDIPLYGLSWYEASAGNYAIRVTAEDMSSNTANFLSLVVEGGINASSIIGRNNSPITITNPEIKGDLVVYPNILIGSIANYDKNVTRISLNERVKTFSEVAMYVTKSTDTDRRASNLFINMQGDYGTEFWNLNVMIGSNRTLFFTDGTNTLSKMVTDTGNTTNFGVIGYLSTTKELDFIIGANAESRFSFKRAYKNVISTNGVIIPSTTTEVFYVDVYGRSVIQQIKSKEKIYGSGLEIGSWTDTSNKNLLNIGWLGSTTYTEQVIQGKTSTATNAYNVNFMKFIANSSTGVVQLLAKTELRGEAIVYNDIYLGGRSTVESGLSSASFLFMGGSILEFGENWSDTSESGYGCEMGFNNNTTSFYSIIGNSSESFIFGKFASTLSASHSAADYDGMPIVSLFVIKNTGVVEAKQFKTVASSDSTIKENLRVKDCVSLFKSFGNYYTFDFTEDARNRSSMLDKSGEGFIAQNIQKVMPEAVEVTGNNWLAIDYFKIYNIGMGALKQLIDRVEELEQQIIELKKK